MEKYIVKDRIVCVFILDSQRHYYYDATNQPTFLTLDSNKATPLDLEDAQEVIRRMQRQPGEKWHIFDIDPNFISSDEAEKREYEALARQARETGRIY